VVTPLAKSLTCRAGDEIGLFHLGPIARRSHRGYVRAVNNHATPARFAENFKRQLLFFRQHFSNTNPSRLDDVLKRGTEGASILISFDDGYRSNYDVAVPLLEEFGFTGWFFVSSGRHRNSETGGSTVDGEPAESFMSFQEMRDLIDRGHVIGCHSHSHIGLSDQLSDADLVREIPESRAILQNALGDPIDNFCWVGGGEHTYSARAARAIEDAGYSHAFMTNLLVATNQTDPLWIERTNLEADWPLSTVRFYLSGVMDLAYAGKRRRIARRLKRSDRPAQR
jgi:peptidoglycan/xylan/chitin deacetylase (PgdA/CDA1 family)